MPVVIKVFFAVLVLSTAAVVAVILSIHFRIKRHLRSETPATTEPAPGHDTKIESAPLPASETPDGSTGPANSTSSS
jgi:hypothetical protein